MSRLQPNAAYMPDGIVVFHSDGRSEFPDYSYWEISSNGTFCVVQQDEEGDDGLPVVVSDVGRTWCGGYRWR